MKNKNLKFVAAAAIAASTMMTGRVAMAEDLPQTTARQQLSVTQGLAGTSLPVLQRAAQADQGTVSAALIEKLRPGSTHSSASNGGKLQIAGEQWSLEVSSDGTSAEFRDLAVEGLAHSLGKPVTQKMPATELEQKGRAFVASKLASQIVLANGEQLVALRADYRSEGGQDLTTGKTSSAVVANRIVFGRMIDGVPVVGNGSKVFVTFANDGSVESFRYDWPAYQTGSSQAVVGASEVLSRVQKVMGVRSGFAPSSVVATPANGTKAYPLALSSNTQLQALECGYYDPGFKTGKNPSVQPGCTYLTVSHDLNGMRSGFAGAVPAGASFTVDSTWMETQILSAK